MTKKRRVALAASILTAFAIIGVGAHSYHSGTLRGLPRNPLSTYALPGGERVLFDGRVVERLDAGSYVYLGVERPSGERSWVVTLASSKGAAIGVAEVHVVAMGHAEHFSSKRLDRGFDDLYFAVVRPG